MKKTLYILLGLLALILFYWVFYLNEVVLPQKIRAALTEFVETSTDYKIHIGPTRFNILRGVVFSNILISDGKEYIMTAEGVSCGFVMPLLLKKQVVIPSIRIDRPSLILERTQDGMVPVNDILAKLFSAKGEKTGIVIRHISISGASIKIIDRKMNPVFEKTLDSVDVRIWLRLPSQVSFSLTRKLPDELMADMEISGSYDMASDMLKVRIRIDKFDPRSVRAYYRHTGLSVEKGRLDILADAQIEKGRLHYGGVCDVGDMSLSGVDTLGKISNIEGRVQFSGSGIESEDLDASIFGLPFKMRVNYSAQPEQLARIRFSSAADLSELTRILKEDFAMDLGQDISGDSSLVIDVKYAGADTKTPDVKGYLKISDGRAKLLNGRFALGRINGVLNFTRQYVNWSGLGFVLGQKDYSTSGELSDFGSPRVRMDVSGDILDARFDIEIKKDIVKIYSCSGKYMGSSFSVSGESDISDPFSVESDIKGRIELDLADLPKIFSGSREKLSGAKLSGIVRADFVLGGDVSNPRSCEIRAKVSSEEVSFYGFRATSLGLDYLQSNALMDLSSLKASIYGGTLDAWAKIDLAREEMPYSAGADIKGARIERIKADTAFKDKDISGIIKLNFGIQGLFGKAESMKGSGKLDITDGKLWQLNLMHGLGALIFSSDFYDVVFREGSCGFIIDGGVVYTDDLELKSDLLYLYGPVKIDFSNNIKADIKAELTDEAMDPGFRKNIATAIGRYTLVDISGTLKQPVYRMKPDIGGIVEGIQENIFQ